MSTLLSLLLITKSSGHATLLLAVPEHPAPIPRTTRPIYSKPVLKKTGGGSKRTTNHYSDSDEPDSEDDKFYRPVQKEGQYLNLPRKVLADACAPESEMCDKKFEMVINHLAFIGHPVTLKKKREAKSKSREDGRQKGASVRRVADSLERRGRTRTSTRLMEASSSSSPEDQRFPRSGVSAAGPSTFAKTTGLGGVLSSSPTHSDIPRIATMESLPDYRGPSPPPPMSPRHEEQTLPEEGQKAERKNSTTTTSFEGTEEDDEQEMGSAKLTMFNLVLVIDTPPDSDLSEHLDAYYRDIILPVTAALKQEEKASSWLTEEKVAIVRQREELAEKGNLFPFPHITSPLVRALTDVYIGLKNATTPMISLRHRDLSVVLHEVSTSTNPMGGASANENAITEWGRHSFWGVQGLPAVEGEEERSRSVDIAMAYDRVKDEAEEWANFRPWNRWQTLLPIVEADKLSNLTSDETLKAFLDYLSPVINFVSYATLLNISPESMKKIVEHMIKWKKGRVIEVISFKNTLAALTKLFAENKGFSKVPPLPAILSSLSPARPFSTIIPRVPPLGVALNEHKSTYLDVLTWLLQKELVVQAHFYIRLVARPEIKRRARDNHFRLKRERRKARAEDGGSASGEVSPNYLTRTTSSSSISSSLSIHGPQPPISPSHFPSSPASILARSAGNLTRSGNDGGSNASESDWEEDMLKLSEDVDTPSIIVEPARLTRVERKWLEEIYAEKTEELAGVLKSIVHLCNGKHGDYEIMQRTGVTRRGMRAIRREFEEDLIVTLHVP
ncbi:hypothetical protein BT69DRAFT_1338323 [Atractiella rhizophila]|nr:hypothetical protein BT69DRAFT_1338323 [Atractiella rhizophila]